MAAKPEAAAAEEEDEEEEEEEEDAAAEAGRRCDDECIAWDSERVLASMTNFTRDAVLPLRRGQSRARDLLTRT